MKTFILVVSRAQNLEGKWVPAIEIAKRRLKAKEWAFFSNTRCRKKISINDEIIVYLSGAPNGMAFVAKAKISTISDNVKTYIGEGLDILTDIPTSKIELESIEWFDTPIPIHSIKDNLEFIPKNNPKWGCVLQGGAREISKLDRDLIMSLITTTIEN